MSADQILNSWRKKEYAPVYWLEGDEPYFINEVVSFAEHRILPESEAAFNLSVFYGRDADWAAIVNACRRYPMFAERQVVIVKEAQYLRDIEKLEAYIVNPLSSTTLVVSYKDKKLDARTKFAKVVKQAGVVLTTKKIYDNQLPEWISSFVASTGKSIQQRAVVLLADHIGNDLSRLRNEVDKIIINLGERNAISEEDVETYTGISKEFNVFELQNAVMKKDLVKAVRIIRYFEENPKAAPIQLVLPSLYGLFSKLCILHSLGTRDEKTVASALGVNPFFVRDYIQAASLFDAAGAERGVLLLSRYNLKSIGIDQADTGDAGLLRELVAKLVL